MRTSGSILLCSTLLAGCAMAPLTKTELASHEISQLCTALAETTITGQAASLEGRPVYESSLVEAIRAQNGSCTPWNSYLQTAGVRIQYRFQREQQQQAQSAAMIAAGTAMMDASRPVVLGSPAPLPAPSQSQTVCHTDAFGRTVCDTNTQ